MCVCVRACVYVDVCLCSVSEYVCVCVCDVLDICSSGFAHVCVSVMGRGIVKKV